jgi:F-type H+-transporting ATPase subunit epsilon
MAKFSRSFRCDILTPTGLSQSMEALSASFPAPDGLVGILGGRAPLVSLIGVGPLTVRATDGRQHDYFLDGGFAQMNDDVLLILAEQCIATERLDRETVWEEIAQARRMPLATDAEMARRDRALDVARIKFSLIQRRRRRRQMPAPSEEDMVND